MGITSETSNNTVYVIAGLAPEYRQKYKYYSDFATAVADCPAEGLIVLEGMHLLNATYRSNVNVRVSAGATLKFKLTSPSDYPVHNSWNIYCDPGASIILANQGQFINANIFGKPTVTMEFGTNWDIRVEENMTSHIDIGILYSYNIWHADEIFGYLLFNADAVYRMSTEINFIGLQMQTAPDRIIVRAGYSTAGILFESGAYTPAYATIRDSMIKVDNTRGAVSIFENNEAPNLKIINSNLTNSNNASTACGINNYQGNGNPINITLINTIIKTTHASSNSIRVATADGNTGVVTGMNSWANKALGTDVTQTITSGVTIDANVEA